MNFINSIQYNKKKNSNILLYLVILFKILLLIIISPLFYYLYEITYYNNIYSSIPIYFIHKSMKYIVFC